MKKYLLTAALTIAVSVSAYAQGQVEFDNLATGNPATSPAIFNTDGTTGLDDNYVAQLWGGADAGSIVPLGATLTFFSASSGGAGFVNTAGAAVRTLTGFNAGDTATFVVQVWNPNDGATYDEAVLVQGAITGQSLAFTQVLGGPGTPPSTPPKLTNLQSFNAVMTPVPEPSVIMLGIAGAGLLWFRRKK